MEIRASRGCHHGESARGASSYNPEAWIPVCGVCEAACAPNAVIHGSRPPVHAMMPLMRASGANVHLTTVCLLAANRISL